MHMKAWPDVRPALSKLRESGIRLAFLSNFSPAMMDANINSAGLTEIFEHKLSTDAVGVYKPHPKAYQMGIEAFSLKARGNPFRSFRRMGRGRRQALWLSNILGQSPEATA